MRNKKWTIIMQISAENNLFDDMITVMQELYNIRMGILEKFAQINFLAVFDGITAKKFSTDFARPSIYEIKPNSNFLVEYPINKRFIRDDLSKIGTLTSVYQFIRDNFPADRYGYIYKGHGGPATGDIGSGVFFEKLIRLPASAVNDEDAADRAVSNIVKGWRWAYEGNYAIKGYSTCKYNEQYVMVILSRRNQRALSYRMMAEVLRNVFSDTKLEFIFLDCCWGMQLENAYTFRDICHYFIASADEMPAAGIGYTDFLNKIVSRPQIIGREIANLLLSVYFSNKYDDYDDGVAEFRKMGVSLTNLKTRDIESFIEKFNGFCDYLRENMEKFGLIIKLARACCDDYTYAKPNEYGVFNIDLIWFLENLGHFNNRFVKDSELTNRINELIYFLSIKLRYGYLGNNYKDITPGMQGLGGRGITITFPENLYYYNNSILAEKNTQRPVFINETGWESLLHAYYNYVRRVQKKPQEYIEQYYSQPLGNVRLLKFFNVDDVLSDKAGENFKNSFEASEPGTKSKWGKVKTLKHAIRKRR